MQRFLTSSCLVSIFTICCLNGISVGSECLSCLSGEKHSCTLSHSMTLILHILCWYIPAQFLLSALILWCLSFLQKNKQTPTYLLPLDCRAGAVELCFDVYFLPLNFIQLLFLRIKFQNCVFPLLNFQSTMQSFIIEQENSLELQFSISEMLINLQYI